MDVSCYDDHGADYHNIIIITIVCFVCASPPRFAYSAMPLAPLPTRLLQSSGLPAITEVRREHSLLKCVTIDIPLCNDMYVVAVIICTVCAR